MLYGCVAKDRLTSGLVKNRHVFSDAPPDLAKVGAFYPEVSRGDSDE